MHTPLKLSIQLGAERFTVSLYQRPNSPHYWAKFSLHGKRVRWSTGESSLRRAQMVAAEKAPTLAAAAERDQPDAPLKLLVKLYLTRRFPDPSPKAPYHATHCGDRSLLNIFRDHCGDALDFGIMSAREAKSIIVRFLNERRGLGLSGTTVDNGRRVLSRFFGFLIAEGRVPFEMNPASRLAVGKIHKPDTQMAGSLTPEQFEQFRQVAEKKWYWIGIVLVACAGLRPIGTTRLRWKRDIDWERRILRVKEKGIPHEISFNEWTLAELKRARRRRRKRVARLMAEAQAFRAKWGGQLSAKQLEKFKRMRVRVIPHERNWLTRRVTALMKKTFGPTTELRWRNLRNSFQQWLLDRGVSVKDVAALAKNSEKIVLSKYAKVRQTRLHVAANQLDLRPVRKPEPTVGEAEGDRKELAG